MKEFDLVLGDVNEAQYNRYNMKIKLEGKRIVYWINGEKVFDGEQDYYKTGKFGFNVWNGPSEFKNVKLKVTENVLAETSLLSMTNDTDELSTNMTETLKTDENKETLPVEKDNTETNKINDNIE